MNIPEKAGKNLFSGFFMLLFLLMFSASVQTRQFFIPLNAETRHDRLQPYDITCWRLDKKVKVQWLLSYCRRSFLLPNSEELRREYQVRGVSFEVISDQMTQAIFPDSVLYLTRCLSGSQKILMG